MTTNNLQAELPGFSTKRIPQPLDERTLYAKKTFLGALKYVIQCGNFEYDKEVYQPLGIDAGNWTRIMNGSASFPQDKEEELQDLCGNNGLVLWRAFRRGFRCERILSDLERENTELKIQLADKERELETLAKYGVIQRARA